MELLRINVRGQTTVGGHFSVLNQQFGKDWRRDLCQCRLLLCEEQVCSLMTFQECVCVGVCIPYKCVCGPPKSFNSLTITGPPPSLWCGYGSSPEALDGTAPISPHQSGSHCVWIDLSGQRRKDASSPDPFIRTELPSHGIYKWYPCAIFSVTAAASAVRGMHNALVFTLIEGVNSTA